jgi:hypothetical protein
MSDFHITPNSYQKIYSPSFVRLHTPLKSLSKAEKEPALDLFRKLMNSHYPNSGDTEIQKLQGPSCTFEMMVKFLDDHTFPSCTNKKTL